MADIRHTLSLDDRPFNAAMSRSEQRAAGMANRTQQRMDGMGRSVARNVASVNRLTKAFLGFNILRAPLRFATFGLQTFSDLTNDAAGNMTRLTSAWEGYKAAIGAGVSRTGAPDFLTRALRFISGDGGLPAQRESATRGALAIREGQKVSELRSRGDTRGADLIEENARHRQTKEELSLLATRLQFLGLRGFSASLGQGENARHTARLDEIDRDEARRILSRQPNSFGEDARERPALPVGAVVGRADRSIRFDGEQRKAQAKQADEEKKQSALLAKILEAIKNGTAVAVYGP